MIQRQNINDIILKRRSIRKYDPSGVVTEVQIKAMLEAAMLAPSAVNSRPWEFIVVQGRNKLDSIAGDHPYAQMMKTASCAIIITANPDALKGTKIDGMQMWQHDCGAAAQNILLQAAYMDLGTCWCGIHPNEDRMDSFRKMFAIAQNRIPFCVIAVGIAAEDFGSRGFYEESKIKWIN
ncbi:MAG: nitroreductase family protein [Firmicutes bacterium]|nr:nitroreductase family protein [Bacillota bacterium]